MATINPAPVSRALKGCKACSNWPGGAVWVPRQTCGCLQDKHKSLTGTRTSLETVVFTLVYMMTMWSPVHLVTNVKLQQHAQQAQHVIAQELPKQRQMLSNSVHGKSFILGLWQRVCSDMYTNVRRSIHDNWTRSQKLAPSYTAAYILHGRAEQPRQQLHM